MFYNQCFISSSQFLSSSSCSVLFLLSGKNKANIIIIIEGTAFRSFITSKLSFSPTKTENLISHLSLFLPLFIFTCFLRPIYKASLSDFFFFLSHRLPVSFSIFVLHSSRTTPSLSLYWLSLSLQPWPPGNWLKVRSPQTPICYRIINFF